jgi:signal transduction histidine kinase
MEELDLMKKNALGILSHEARTPLNGILLGSELLLGCSHPDPETEKFAELIRDSGLRLKDLVDKISRYCELQDGAQLFVEEKDVVTEIKDALKTSSEELSVDLIVESGSPSYSCDWKLVKEAIVYLLENAYERSSAGSKVTLHLEARQDQLQITVVDSGDRLRPDFCERIFDGLYTPDLMKHQKGSGLGLAIVKEIVSLHGGDVSCRLSGDCEVVFSMQLPPA